MYRILIVEDNRLSIQALETVIAEEAHFAVTDSVRDDETALQICKEEKIDIVFLGSCLTSTGGSSIQAAAEIRHISPGTELYIVAAGVYDPFLKDFFELDVGGCLTPPLTFSAVQKLLRKYEHSRHDRAADPMAGKVIRVIEGKDYAAISRVAWEIVMEMEHRHGGSSGEKIRSIGEAVQDRVGTICNEKMDLFSDVPIKDGFADSRIYWGFWLADVMDWALRRVASANCDILSTVFFIVDDNLGAPLMLTEIAGKCNISESYLNKKMRAFMGVSVMEYVQRRKLREAKNKIAFSSMKLGDIAYDLGYNESSYFSKVFRKYEGMTPKQFKSAVLSENRVDW